MRVIKKKSLRQAFIFSALLLPAFVIFFRAIASPEEETYSYLPLVFKNLSNLPQEKIAFMSYRDGNSEVYIMNADGSGQKNITNNASADYNPSWNPVDNRLAFVSHRNSSSDNYGGEIFTMAPDGTDLQRLTNKTGDASPSWSPDGKKIVFVTWRDGNESGYFNSEIYVMNDDGTEVTRLTNNLDNDFHPSWSPDGTKIVFFRHNHDVAIYTMNADGTNETRITLGYSPCWSADGKHIFYVYNKEIYSISIESGDIQQLTNVPEDDGSPSASADGTKVLFQSERDGNMEIYVMNVDGSEQTNLTNHPADDFTARWGNTLKSLLK